jgi:peptidoglycan/LPS O-acetylase OafA/YrhL
MSPVNPLFALAALLVALSTTFIIYKKNGAPPTQGRFAAIDGLRGYLAFFVFLHHACIWYFYLHTGKWDVPPSPLYTHFGKSSVALFFMITGFLFSLKIIKSRDTKIDWANLYTGRILRLAPIYLFSVFILLTIVTLLSNATPNESWMQISGEVLHWLGFTFFRSPDINGIKNTWTIVAGVTWSLVYEWRFYLALPILAFTIKNIPPSRHLALGLLIFFWVAFLKSTSANILFFLAGINTALLVQSEKFCRIARHPTTSLLIISCLAITATKFTSVDQPIPIFLLGLAFAGIAAGNSLFGVLTHAVSRTLGEYAYSIYMLHGIILYVVFYFVVGMEASRQLSVHTYWLLVMAITPVLVGICAGTYRLIEQPPMRQAAQVQAWLQARTAWRLRFN